MNIFVSATDTDVGKTLITAGLAAIMQSLGYKTGVLKPFQSGAIEKNGFLQAQDLAFVKSLDPYVETLVSYILKMPAAPALAAEQEGVRINTKVVQRDFKSLNMTCDTVIVEGSGGLLTPVGPRITIADIVKALDLPLIIVARPDLGTINHTLLTINNAKMMGIKINGVIINKYPQFTDNLAITTVPRLIEEYSDTKIVGIVKDFGNLENTFPSEVIDNLLNSLDLETIFDIRIPRL